ncbi:dolichol-phosphate mannosyltransferase [Actinokineospora alba]|uniref:Dolichol-phosphate mannosyltransferase n=1 Tax=Actinokineospora alba TaxID=504798 RepID=A0A1H0HZA3_9PSEU|nr:glycosyltransferase [Actinokineospora alba]TDP64680.1 dolichol-phosphate mannosyltransferase [Actinokineospora alba]SDI84184.1 dolichol-phosphate mannosyltransferase [Actinokineospora alba]SDO24475.1 dolichol-phosphate mannosyltransferase [Actinokineospora alba]
MSETAPSADATVAATLQTAPSRTATPTTCHSHVVLPAYNEAASLPPLLARLAEVGRAELLTVWVVDDGSSDATAEVAAAGVDGLDVRLVRHPINLGLGQAVRSGLRAALESAGQDDIVVVMDADDTHDPGVIPLLRAEIAAGADVVICSRFTDGGDDDTAPAFRRLLSRGAATLFRRMLRVDGVHDFTSGFRAYRVTLLERASLHWGERLIEEQGFACMVELLLKLRHCHPVITEVPLKLRYDRKRGPSKLKLRRTIVQYLSLLVRDRLAPAPYREL